MVAIPADPPNPPVGFHVYSRGPGGGAIWRGVIPGARARRLRRPDDRRPSAGGFGAVDIALRHPRLFRRVESWGGYFSPFRDGPLRRASPRELAAHDPTLLLPAESGLVRRLGTPFFLSTGPGHGHVTPAQTIRFARPPPRAAAPVPPGAPRPQERRLGAAAGRRPSLGLRIRP
jgi:hypothetical protein